MNSTADNPSSGPSEEQRVQSLDTRFTAIETEQAEQRGLLEQIRDRLGGGNGPAAGDAPSSSAAPEPGDMAEQMRQAVRDVRAEEAAAEHDRAHAAQHDQMSRPAPEQTPREVMVKGKAALQKRLFGADR